jgi:hypothetical protein
MRQSHWSLRNRRTGVHDMPLPGEVMKWTNEQVMVTCSAPKQCCILQITGQFFSMYFRDCLL